MLGFALAVRDEIREKTGYSSSVQTCHIKLQDSDLVAHIWRFLYDTARQYRESIDVYGSRKSIEWTLVEDEPTVLHTAKKPEPEIPRKVEPSAFCECGGERYPGTKAIADLPTF